MEVSTRSYFDNYLGLTQDLPNHKRRLQKSTGVYTLSHCFSHFTLFRLKNCFEKQTNIKLFKFIKKIKFVKNDDYI